MAAAAVGLGIGASAGLLASRMRAWRSGHHLDDGLALGSAAGRDFAGRDVFDGIRPGGAGSVPTVVTSPERYTSAIGERPPA